MDVELHGWVSTPRYSRSCTEVHCHERALYFKSIFLGVFAPIWLRSTKNTVISIVVKISWRMIFSSFSLSLV